MIISCYQGVGKTTLSKNNPEKYLDLESSTFFVNGERSPDWYKVYVQQAVHFSEMGYNVFIASHSVVRTYMDEQKIDYLTVAPSSSLKEEWVKRLKERYLETDLLKDYKAYMNAKEMFNDGVTDLLKHKNHIEIKSMKYDLENLLENKQTRN